MSPMNESHHVTYVSATSHVIISNQLWMGHVTRHVTHSWAKTITQKYESCHTCMSRKNLATTSHTINQNTGITCESETNCNILWRTATYCTATHCNTLQYTASHCNTLRTEGLPYRLRQAATHCNAQQHIALQQTTTHCNTVQHTAAHNCREVTW